ncbi:MAG: EF-P beta-lysylation protein EpmB [Coxiella-like endosymbiont]|uniref:EF-P beta-lysylation protein EpmB n=1 Tax=Coxiella-like endosymbiont TaxID=1592897 RepID=UPI00215A34C8|nr:EF-P beta-lysylation protein EpmB [Coxiella-like endosymbiont]UVE59436.1 EF-P beta-lysylation protein EpmB [Coxiella-like endosymbiont]
MVFNPMNDWQFLLKTAISDPNELWRELELDPITMSQTHGITAFPLRVPRGFMTRMEKRNPRDPLLLQVLPTSQELITYPGYCPDPLNEKQSNRISGLLHKYYGRVLITLSGACAVHCRYCFRRYFSYDENTPGKKGWNCIFNYLKSDINITEIILSGGDPLIVKDTLLKEFIEQSEKITHIKRLRIHTRLPVVIPERITSEFINLLCESRFLSTVVIHCNHPNEIDQSVISALDPLRQSKITLLNQSVLLKNINDNAETLIHLSERLFESGILPYYLNLLDRVEGAWHFEVNEIKAKNLVLHLMKRLPGYLVPKLVREIPGALAKTAVPVTL